MTVTKFFYLAGFFSLVGALSGCGQNERQDALDVEAEMTELLSEEASVRYGIPETGYFIHESEIKTNQFTSDILLPFGVSYAQIAALDDAAKGVQPLNALKAGWKYAVFCDQDSAQTPRYFVVESDKTNYIVYQLRDSIAVFKGQKPVETRMVEAAGIINSSLSATIVEQGMPASLVFELSNIYAWTVDFYRIQKGDYFKVVYEEQFVEGQSIGVGAVLAAEFHHRDRSFRGIRFAKADGVNYFDEEGESLRKAFLKAPLEYSRISSRFSLKRYHPVQKRWKAHLGTDYAAPKGTPILATGDGTVVESAYGKYNGNYVKIRHNGMYTTQYLHMNKRLVKKGEVVKQGQVIGQVGSTGLATGPHVCYRFWKDGKQVDPYREELPQSESLNPVFRAEFNQRRDSLMKIIEGIDINRPELMAEEK